MKIIEGGVTAAKGFEAASTAAKIKYQDRTDMAMIYSQVPCECAGTFTTNVVKAACVKWDQQVVKSGAKAQAVIVNSGIANACTGAEGFGYCKDTADAAAEALGINADGVLIGSTGVIGKQLPIDRIVAGVKALAEKKNDTLANGTEAAKAIMTTDTCEKQIAVEIEVAGKTVTIGIRPEDLHDDEAWLQASPKSVIEATIRVYELLGAEVNLYFDIDDAQFIARVNPRTTARVGSVVKIALDMSKVHVFDKETELIICN